MAIIGSAERNDPQPWRNDHRSQAAGRMFENRAGRLVKKSLESGYPGRKALALRPIHVFAIAIWRKSFKMEPYASDRALRARISASH
jgi:hypothetical protein